MIRYILALAALLCVAISPAHAAQLSSPCVQSATGSNPENCVPVTSANPLPVVTSSPNTFPAAGWAAPDTTPRFATEGAAPTYTASTGLFTPAATPTDLAVLYNPSSNIVVYLKQVKVYCVGTAAGEFPIRLQYTTNANYTTGTFTSINGGSPNLTKHDYSDPTALSTLQYWTVNPTSRNGISGGSRWLIAEQDIVCGVSGTSTGTPVVFDFSGTRSKTYSLKENLNFMFAVNANGVALPAGAQFRIEMTWEEVRQPLTCFIGDSTTSNATAGYMNGGAYIGGFGHQGGLNSYINAINYGSNGFRLQDFINNINAPTFPWANIAGTGVGSPSTTTQVQTGNYYQNCDIIIFTYGINDVRNGLTGSSLATAQNRLTALIDTFLYAVANGTTSGAAYTSPYAAPVAISNITWAANVATVTTSSPHQFSTQAGGSTTDTYSSSGVAVTISGSSNTAFNGTWQLASVTNSTTFTLTMASNPGTFSGTASEQFATIWGGTWSGMPGAKVILYSPNSFTADDTGSGTAPNCWLYIAATGAGSSCSAGFSSLYTNAGLTTLSQIAQADSAILYNAYTPFAGDSRVFALVHQQSLGGGPFPSTVATLANSPLMQNQIHPGSYGQAVKLAQIAPYVVSAAQAITTFKY